MSDDRGSELDKLISNALRRRARYTEAQRRTLQRCEEQADADRATAALLDDSEESDHSEAPDPTGWVGLDW